MGTNSKIEWTDHSWNPWRGCARVSPGCDNCYMMRDAKRFGLDGHTVQRTSRMVFAAPLVKVNGISWKWRDGDRVFACSWSDFFHPDADAWRGEAWRIIRMRPGLTFQILTKRPELMRSRLPGDWGDGWPNVWLGVTAENQAETDEKIPILLSTPAAKRFVSIEPMLGPVDLLQLKRPEHFHRSPYGWNQWLARNLHWVIVGGETGPGARPMHPDWARSIRDQCWAAGVPFFFKQWGEWGFAPGNSATHGLKSDGTLFPCRPGQDLGGAWPCQRMAKRSGGGLDGREWREVPS